ncbi:hypothetical protein HDU91_001107 [Kappamyces sp. JEL0680]|nr:hypothetical protein HDU91_001107 [Kappamyces sp. JEL0680]
MSSLFSWLRTKKEDADYESILEKLDAEIRETELDIASIAISERRVAHVWLFYSIAVYMVLLAAQFLYTKSGASINEDWNFSLLKGFGLWFARQRLLKVELHSELRAKQQLKVEELKKKTSYYMTKGLIERYETPPKDRKNSGASQAKRAAASSGAALPSAGQDATPLRRATYQSPRLQQTTAERANPNPSPAVPASTVAERTWIDRVLDAVVGEAEGPQSKYALICEKCFVHNGLVLPHEYLNATKKGSFVAQEPHYYAPSAARTIMRTVSSPLFDASSRDLTDSLSIEPSVPEKNDPGETDPEPQDNADLADTLSSDEKERGKEEEPLPTEPSVKEM